MAEVGAEGNANGPDDGIVGAFAALARCFFDGMTRGGRSEVEGGRRRGERMREEKFEGEESRKRDAKGESFCAAPPIACYTKQGRCITSRASRVPRLRLQGAMESPKNGEFFCQHVEIIALWSGTDCRRRCPEQ